MRQADMTLLFDHLYWMRDRILETADDPGVALTDPAPVTTRDLRATLVHEVDVEWSWRERLRGEDPTVFSPDDIELAPEDFATIASVRARWLQDESAMRAWLGRLTDDALNAACRAERDGAGAHPFWFHLQHLYTHGVQQLSDAAVLLTRAGRSPGELDFLQFVESRG